ncbi:tetratricopeptide repeat protein [Candidatus Methylospira mobilis]|uniref:O-linked N-acetylglucosamine transferase, SPINDLY family protein n=1 Tax=Candidatus Methylospira mobilis TaxID=1808979 RepID=UPI0028EC470D|nr:tetratricopeptide repeat protein [Candidatus Methylospira mobilis]WNV06874.1 tetratricopeptide repeat protein [Candidatus Methylospira mobilis]
MNTEQAEAHFNEALRLLRCCGSATQAAKLLENIVAAYPNHASSHYLLGLSYHRQGLNESAIAGYQRAIALEPGYADACNNLGVALSELHRYEDSVAAYRRAIAWAPGFADAYHNLGNVLTGLNQHDEAVAAYLKVIELTQGSAEPYSHLGNALVKLGRYADAAPLFQQAIALDAYYPFALGQYIHCKMHDADWDGISALFASALSGIDAGEPVMAPFIALTIPSTPEQQKRCAGIFVRERGLEPAISSGAVVRYKHSKIRLGYFSADFHNHVTAYLIAELFEQHDRDRFEVLAFSYGKSGEDEMRLRLHAGVDRFIDVSDKTDQEIAAIARQLEIDIAININGYTTNARPGLFALHPAPIQASYLGYPGTSGVSHIDYLIADPVVIPTDQRCFYSEKIVYLPHTYQVNRSLQPLSGQCPTRMDAGLPENAFVYCCFNNSFKITPDVFQLWMQILLQVDDSVLWLLEGSPVLTSNLRKEARKYGVMPERIVFAPRLSLSEHLSRQKLADIFLDTLYYNAHTTASDALRAGLPVLTCLGETFSGRVAASLLNALGLPELIVHSHDAYRSLAINLAVQPERLALIKQKLAAHLHVYPLFDTVRFTCNIERAFTLMWERYQNALEPDHLEVVEYQ